ALDEAAIERIRQEQEKAAEREFVRFAFYKVDPAWRRLPVETRNAHKQEFVDVVRDHGEHFMVYAYSLVGTRGDTDFLLWQASRNLDHLHDMAAAILRTGLGAYLTQPHNYFAMTRRSIYINRYEEEYLAKYHGVQNLEIGRASCRER